MYTSTYTRYEYCNWMGHVMQPPHPLKRDTSEPGVLQYSSINIVDYGENRDQWSWVEVYQQRSWVSARKGSRKILVLLFLNAMRQPVVHIMDSY